MYRLVKISNSTQLNVFTHFRSSSYFLKSLNSGIPFLLPMCIRNQSTEPLEDKPIPYTKSKAFKYKASRNFRGIFISSIKKITFIFIFKFYS